MGNRIYNQEVRKHPNTKQNTDTCSTGGAIGDRSDNLVKLIGADRVSQRNFKYEGTYYVTEDGELYDNEYMNTHNPIRTGVNFYEVIDWRYNERKEIYEPVVRRIVTIKIRFIEYQLSLDL
nr:MAG TPA: hypothetical protein [Microviridae sp.]